MSCIPHFHGHTLVHRLDPRARLAAAMLFALLIALSSDALVLATGIAISLALVLLAEIPLAKLWSRFAALNLLMLGLFVLLPLTTPGEATLRSGPFAWSTHGLLLASRIALRANAIVLGYTALVSTMSPVTLGHALSRLRLPASLVQMLMFTIRYIAVLIEEYQRLLRAMRMRCFRHRFEAHTLRSYGYLIGMLLLRSFERADRVLAAMKCRGYNGRFHLLDTLEFRPSDWAFLAASLLIIAGLGLKEWL